MSLSKASFKAYVDLGLNKSINRADNDDNERVAVNNVQSTLTPVANPTPQLLPGETVISEIRSVLRYHLFSEKKKGLNGSLFCTNFRLAYVASVVDDDEEPDWKRNRLIVENDIALSCIDSLYGISKGKKKKLTPRCKLPKRPKVLEVHCKDFRVLSFSFQYADKCQATKVVNDLLISAFPETEKDLFGFRYRGHKDNDAVELTFQTPGDWDFELRRTGAKNWKTVQVNQGYSLCVLLPEVLVVPMSVRTPVLKQAAAQFDEGRLPTWSYTLRCNQASLVRMACLIPDSEHVGIQEELLEAIKQASHGRVQIVDLNKQLPSLQDLRSALYKLREICLPLTTKDLGQTDESWYSSLEACRWIHFISQCLEMSASIAGTMRKGKSVVIREPGSSDYCCLVSSLVQLLLDPFYRTRAGFEALIRKEWVTMGHRFLTRLGLVQTSLESDEAPIFQLFLDCVWQISAQFPSSFEFSETYLTALSDSAYMGMFSEFMFDNLYQARKWARESGKYNKTKFLSVWNWSVQFTDKFQSLFINPIYDDLGVTQAGENGAEASCAAVETYLKPSWSMPTLTVWSQCYLRWLTPVAILNGGAPSQYLTQCKLVSEIQKLEDEFDELDTDHPELRHAKRPDLILSYHSNSSSSRYPSYVEEILTSSFPFTPLSLKEEFMAVTARTIDYVDSNLDLATRTIDYVDNNEDLSEGYNENDCSVLDD